MNYILKTLVKIPFTSISNNLTSCDILVKYEESTLKIYFPLLSIHRQYSIDSYVLSVDTIAKDDDGENIDIYNEYNIDPFNLLACPEIRYKGHSYHEVHNIELDYDIVNRCDIKIWVDEDGEIPDYVEETGSGVLMNTKSLSEFNISRTGEILDINFTKDDKEYIDNVYLLNSSYYMFSIILFDSFDSIVYNTYKLLWNGEFISIDVKDKLFTLDDYTMIPYVNGMQVGVILSVLDSGVDIDAVMDDTEAPDEVLLLSSNNLPITRGMYYDIIYGSNVDDDILNEINSDDMNNINIVNKTITEVSNNIIEGAQSIIMKPVFFRMVEASDITLRLNIVDRIAINLDAYKSKVDSFNIRINNIYYSEIGRTVSGIVFAINGVDLIDAPVTGYYYICDDDYDVVTSGNYSIE